MDVLKNLLKEYQDKGATILAPAPEEVVSPFRMTLARHKIPQPAPDYFKFLTVTDAVIFNGLKFYGIRTHQREEKNYTFPSLLEVNVAFLERKRTHDMIILGENNEDLIIYHTKDKNYQIVDKMDLVAEVSLPRFYDILYFYGEELLKGP
ncbi:MAG: YrhA family protein [Alphaproteobacteria bacterium]|nr:YrhA family protein [Alphaproteobacteria bacterium]